MIRFLIIIIFVTSCNLSQSQNYFKNGVENFNQGNYIKADSLFFLHLRKFPRDMNAMYNYGSTKLLLGDTCKFCDIMLRLCHREDDNDACKLFISKCGSFDTIYYDKYYNIPTGRRYRYSEITEINPCYEYKTVYVSDKKNHWQTIILGSDFFNPRKTNIIAVYRIYNDNSKLFIFAKSQPSFPGGVNARYNYRKKNKYIKEAIEELNLDKVIADIQYIVDKNGDISNIKLVGVNKGVKNYEKLEKYINLIISGMPRQIPAKYKDKCVDYLVSDYISFYKE